MTVHFENIGKPEDFDVHTALPERVRPTRGYDAFGKRALDVTLILCALPLVLPLLVMITLMLWASGHRPFYRQKRVGMNGEIFRILKYRTMVENAEEALDRYLKENEAARLEWDSTQKLKNDPRITTVGRILRKTSLDELPQLWNVLCGEMSLVGPRPMMVSQQGMYPGTAYYDLRPGITGLWQISKRNDCEFRDRAHFDAVYRATMSLGTDLSVLVRTAVVVLRGTGY